MGWIGTALTLWGSYAVGNKAKFGFLLQLAGNLCWLVAGVQRATPDLIVVSAAFAAMYAFNFWKWHNDAIAQK